jgi:hypothetical protein
MARNGLEMTETSSHASGRIINPIERANCFIVVYFEGLVDFREGGRWSGPLSA